MECSHARLLLLFNAPGPSEFLADEAESFRAHVEQCPSCRTLARREQLTDAALGPALRNVPMPTHLSERILERLQRERRPSPWPWAVGAAGLLLAVGIGLALYYQPLKPLFDQSFVEEWRSPGPKTENVESWFRTHGVSMSMPPDFVVQDLDSWEIVEMQGQRVAKLLYVKTGEAGHDTAVAHVYVIPKRAFRLDKDFEHQARSKSGNMTLDEQGEFFFLSIFSRGSRSAFMGSGGI